MITTCTPQECKDIARQASETYAVLADEQQLKARALQFQALGNETRLRIVGLLAVRELCVCDIVAALEGAASTIAHHLRMLEDAGLITSRQESRFTLYRLNSQALDWSTIFE